MDPTMEHTYKLSCDGFISPEFMRNSHSPRVMGVEHPRTIRLEGMTLRLHDNQPDLPVGVQVQVWLDRYFLCETVEYIEAKAAACAERAAARQAHEDSVKRSATSIYFEPTQELIAGNPTVSGLREKLDALYVALEGEERLYHQFWRTLDPQNKQKSNDALSVARVINDSIRALSDYVFGQLATQGIKGISSHAVSPHEGARSGLFDPGKDHFKLLTPVAYGKFKRSKGDALCKPYVKFFCLQDNEVHRAVTCCACLDRMLRLLNP